MLAGICPGRCFYSVQATRGSSTVKLPKPKPQAFLSLHHNHFSGFSILPPSPLPHNSSLRLIAPSARPHNAGHSSFFKPCFQAGPACSSPRGCHLDRLRRASAAPFFWLQRAAFLTLLRRTDATRLLAIESPNTTAPRTRMYVLRPYFALSSVNAIIGWPEGVAEINHSASKLGSSSSQLIRY